MPIRISVDLIGDLVAVSARGELMGNRVAAMPLFLMAPPMTVAALRAGYLPSM